jgi:hypothetical protein
MRVYTVHEPPGLRGHGAAAAQRIVFVKDGFCWPALFVAPLWLIYHRMWLVLLGYLAASIVLEALATGLGPESFAAGLPGLLFALYFALEANNLRRWHLSRKGYALRAVTAGRDRAECERRFFAGWLADEDDEAAPYVPPPSPAPVPPTGGGVIGLFPEPGGR